MKKKRQAKIKHLLLPSLLSTTTLLLAACESAEENQWVGFCEKNTGDEAYCQCVGSELADRLSPEDFQLLIDVSGITEDGDSFSNSLDAMMQLGKDSKKMEAMNRINHASASAEKKCR